MKVNKISMSKKKAKEYWTKYLEVIHERTLNGKIPDKTLVEMKALYYHLKQGKKLIDIYNVFKEIGVNEKEEPKLAIAPAQLKRIEFKKESGGRGVFKPPGWRYSYSETVSLPSGTFPNWSITENRFSIKNQEIQTTVPIIPAPYYPKGKLNLYHILWEAKNWKEVTKDPLLLKRITNNVFVVLAGWDLSPLEQAVISGRL